MLHRNVSELGKEFPRCLGNKVQETFRRITLTSVFCRQQTRSVVEEPHFHVGSDGFLFGDEPLLLGLLLFEDVIVVVLAHLQLLSHLHHQLVHIPVLGRYLQCLCEVGDRLFVLLVLSEDIFVLVHVLRSILVS